MSSVQPGWFPDPSDATKSRWWDGNQWTVHVSRDGHIWAENLPAPRPASARRVPIWAWILIGVVALVVMLLLPSLVALVALVVLITAIVGVSTGSRTWLRLASRRVAIGATAGAAAVLLVAGSVSAAYLPRGDEAPIAEPARFAASASPESTSSLTPTPTPTPVTTTREEVVTEPIPFERTTAEDAGLPRGHTAITVGGQDGQRSLTYRVTLVDGVETGRELTADVVSVHPVAEVTTIGTLDPPPPPPPAAPAQPSNCHSSYAEACVPIDSDVDCAGGSGNGPSYFSGVARVVGPDVYDLDRDGDGWACED